MSGISPEEFISNRDGQAEVCLFETLKGIPKIEQTPVCGLLQAPHGSDHMKAAQRHTSSADFVYQDGINNGFLRKLDCLAFAEIKFV